MNEPQNYTKQRKFLEKRLSSAKERNNLQLRLQLARLLLEEGEIEKLKGCLTQFQAVSRISPELALEAATILSAGDLQPAAFQLTSTALSRHPDSIPLAAYVLGLCDRLNRVEHGIDILNNLPENTTSHPLLQLRRATLLRRQGKSEKARDLLAHLTQSQPQVKAHQWNADLWHESFRILDDLGEFQDAYEALLKSKEANLARFKPSAVERLRATKEESYKKMLQIVSCLNERDLKTWRHQDSTPNPPTFLLGHPRSGTTLLENILESHSKIISTDERPSFHRQVISEIQKGFSPVTDDATTPRQFVNYLTSYPATKLARCRKNYLLEIHKRLSLSANHSFHLIDKNPALTDGLLLIHRLFPSSKIIFAHRDPKAVIWSAFALPTKGLSMIGSFWYSLEDVARAYNYISKIWNGLKAKIEPTQFHEIRYEKLIRDLETEGKKATEFLGLNWENTQKDFYEHAREKVIRSPTYREVSKPIDTSSLDHWKNYAEMIDNALNSAQR